MQKSQVIPLLLPKPAGTLLIIGWEDFLLDTDFINWDNILVFSRKAKTNKPSFTFVYDKLEFNYQAILVLSTREYKYFQTHNQLPNTPFAYFGRFCDLFNVVIKKKDYYLIYGHPYTNPLYWFAYRNHIKQENRITYKTNIISPRGRFGQLFLSLDKILQKLLPKFITTHFIICDSSCSVLGKYIYETNKSGCLIQSTKTGKFILFDSNVIIKIIYAKNNNSTVFNSFPTSVSNIPNSKNITNFIPHSEIEWQDNCEVTRENNFKGEAAYQHLGNTESLLKIFNNTSDFLLQWYGSTASEIINERWLEKNVNSFEVSIKAQLDLTHQIKLDKISRILAKRCTGIKIPKVPVHGDLWLNNIIVDPDSLAINGIIDWDFSRSDGLPFVDLFHLLSWRSSRFQADFSTKKLFTPHGKYQGVILRHASKLGFSEKLLNEFYIIYWLQNTSKMLQYGVEKTIGFRYLFPKSLDLILKILTKT